MVGCSSGAGNTAVDIPPPEVAAQFDLVPTNPRPGETLEARFDPLNSRGGYFHLFRWDGAKWEGPLFQLESDHREGFPSVDPFTETSGGLDYGLEGPGPDGLLLPTDLEVGYWRLCTAWNEPKLCAQFVVEMANS